VKRSPAQAVADLERLSLGCVLGSVVMTCAGVMVALSDPVARVFSSFGSASRAGNAVGCLGVAAGLFAGRIGVENAADRVASRVGLLALSAPATYETNDHVPIGTLLDAAAREFPHGPGR
jgi:hypothetical protein